MKRSLTAALLSTLFALTACTGSEENQAKPFKPGEARAVTPQPYLNAERFNVCDLLTAKEQSDLGARGGVPLLDFAEDGFITCSESDEPTIRWGVQAHDEGVALRTRVTRGGWKPLKGVGDEALTTTSNEHAVVARFGNHQVILSDRSDDPRPLDELAGLMTKMGTRLPKDPDEVVIPQTDSSCPVSMRPPARDILKSVSGQIFRESGNVTDDGSITCSYVADGGTIINLVSAKDATGTIERKESEDEMTKSSKRIRIDRAPAYLIDDGAFVRLNTYSFTDRTADVEIHMGTSTRDYQANDEPDPKAVRQLAALFVKSLRP